jgi:hypothetical protein
MDTALQALRGQARLDLRRAVDAVRPDLLVRFQLLTVVHGRIRRIPCADQLVRLVQTRSHTRGRPTANGHDLQLRHMSVPQQSLAGVVG